VQPPFRAHVDQRLAFRVKQPEVPPVLRVGAQLQARVAGGRVVLM
jgi:hypothetical protein